MRILKSLNELVNRVLEIFLVLSFTAMTIIIFLQIIFRYFLLQSLSWSEEIARYLFVWLTFLGAAAVARSRSHIMVSSIINSIRHEQIRKCFRTLAEILVLIFLYVLASEGFLASFEILELGQVSPSIPWFLLGWVYFAIPLGSFFMALNIIEQIWDLWRGNAVKGGH